MSVAAGERAMLRTRVLPGIGYGPVMRFQARCAAPIGFRLLPDLFHPGADRAEIVGGMDHASSPNRCARTIRQMTCEMGVFI